MYTLTITEEDRAAIDWIGGRYSWGEALAPYGEGEHTLEEWEAWEVREAFEADTEGGHSFFPCLSHDSPLARKLFRLMEEII